MNIKNSKRLIKHTYKKKLEGYNIPPMFHGATGVGKTQCMEQAGDEIKDEMGLSDFRVTNLRLSQKEQGDLIGLPQDIEMVPCPYCVENGHDKFEENFLFKKSKLLQHVYGVHSKEFNGRKPTYPDLMDIIRSKYSHLIDRRTGYSVPQDLPKKGHGILHLDEVNRAVKGVRDAVFQLIEDGNRLGNYQLPKGWMIISSVNPPSDEYIVYDLDIAMVARYFHVRFTPEHSEWMKFAAEEQLYDPVRQFVAEYPHVLGNEQTEYAYKPIACPRTFHKMAIMLDGLPEDLVYEVASGFVGTEIASSYMSTLNSKEKPVPAEDILKKYSKVRDQITEYARTKNNRADLLRMSIDDLLVKLDKRKDDLSQENITNLYKFIKDIPKDLTVGFIKLMTKSDSPQVQSHFRKISSSPKVRKMIQDNFSNIGNDGA